MQSANSLDDGGKACFTTHLCYTLPSPEESKGFFCHSRYQPFCPQLLYTGSSASTGPPAHKPEADVYQRTVRQYMTLAAEIKPRGRSQARIHSFNRYSQCQALASLMSLKQR